MVFWAHRDLIRRFYLHFDFILLAPDHRIFALRLVAFRS